MAPHRERQRHLDDGLADAVLGRCRPRPARLVLVGVVAGTAVIEGPDRQPDQFAEALHAQLVIAAQLLELSETTCPTGPRA